MIKITWKPVPAWQLGVMIAYFGGLLFLFWIFGGNLT